MQIAFFDSTIVELGTVLFKFVVWLVVDALDSRAHRLTLIFVSAANLRWSIVCSLFLPHIILNSNLSSYYLGKPY